MESNDEEFNQSDETEWIERDKHELILRKYRLNTQRILKEYQTKIQQQNQRIEMLTKKVKRQKFIIDTFADKSIETLDNNQMLRKTADRPVHIENVYTIPESEPEPEQEPEQETLIYIDAEEQSLSNQIIKIERDISLSPHHPKEVDELPKVNGFHRTQNVRKKPSLVSIQIQPNIPDSDNVYVCDECNKTMSSRRVLVVIIFDCTFNLWPNVY